MGLVALVLGSVVAIAAPTGATTASAATRDDDVAPGSIGVRLVDTPTGSADDPRTHIYIVDHLAPGTVVHRRIEVSSTSASTTHVALYSSAAAIANGAFLGAAGHESNDLSTWTSVTPDASDVAANGRVTATVTVAVPDGAAPGEQYGVVWAEAASTPVAGGVTQVSRVGIRLYISVGPGGAPAADFSIESLTPRRAPDGRPMVLASVHNTGGRALDLAGTLQLGDGPAGLRAGPFDVNLGTTLGVGETEPVTIDLDQQTPAGPWLAEISLHSGLLERRAQATITFPATGTAPPVQTTTPRSAWLDLGLLGLALVALALALVTLERWRRRHVTDEAASGAPADQPIEPPATNGDELPVG